LRHPSWQMAFESPMKCLNIEQIWDNLCLFNNDVTQFTIFHKYSLSERKILIYYYFHYFFHISHRNTSQVSPESQQIYLLIQIWVFCRENVSFMVNFFFFFYGFFYSSNFFIPKIGLKQLDFFILLSEILLAIQQFSFHLNWSIIDKITL